MKRYAWLACFACLSAFLIGCSGEEAPADEATETTTTAPAGGSEEGSVELVAFTNGDGKLVCPLMGSVIENEEDAVGWVEHDGKKYAMCCAPCLEKGTKDPAMVAEKAAEL